MARITVEDCIGKVSNRFELVILAAYRANGINSGLPITVEREKDKYPVIALREIAEETVKIPALRAAFIKHFQHNVEVGKFDDKSLTTEVDIDDELEYPASKDEFYYDENSSETEADEDDNFNNSDFEDFSDDFSEDKQ